MKFPSCEGNSQPKNIVKKRQIGRPGEQTMQKNWDDQVAIA
jgi:hypothetical protein